MKIYGDKQIIATLGDRGGFCTRFWRDFEPGEALTLRASKAIGEPVVIEKIATIDGRTATFEFEPEDTDELDAGVYVYDIRLTGGAQGPFTVLPHRNPLTGAKRTLTLEARV